MLHIEILARQKKTSDTENFSFVSDFVRLKEGGKHMGYIHFLEQLQYEARPIIYGLISIYSFVVSLTTEHPSAARTLLLLGAVLLAYSCVSVVHMRYVYRTKYLR